MKLGYKLINFKIDVMMLVHVGTLRYFSSILEFKYKILCQSTKL